MSLATDIADAVVTELAHYAFSQDFEPKMLVLPDFSTEELETLRVSVVPGGVEIDQATRSSSKYTVTVSIGVQKRITGTPEETVATMGALVDEIADFLKSTDLSQFPAAQWHSLTNEPIYVPEHLSQKRTFTSVLSLKYLLFD
ncbi:MAG TPA: hypothetical protein DEB39_12145 [Planctomycetaceae bacterium]|nr:hypothetical protein [Planctomycetaceae bacterium]